MTRRVFMAGSAGASLGTTLGPARASGGVGSEAAAGASRQLLELRRYRFRFGPMEARFGEYARRALVPALNRAGVKPVGGFSVLLGPESPSAYLLLPHPSEASVSGLAARLAADEEYRRDAAAFRSLPASDPPYVRREASLMAAFDSMPAVEAPSGALAAPSRVFELRTYASHNEAAGLKKIEMFEQGGEIAIFRRVGLSPVFFARDLIGATLPSLTYMLVFPELAARDKTWAVFRDDPEWVKLRDTPGYSNAEILTEIHTTLLRPTAYSQI
jgi:hypothetical protein